MQEPQARLRGRWRIIELEQWDQDFVDLMAPGRVELDADGTGSFHFGCVNGWFTWPPTALSFRATWDGNDEMDSAHGTFEASLDEEGNLTGTVVFHGGDESDLFARRWVSTDGQVEP